MRNLSPVSVLVTNSSIVIEANPLIAKPTPCFFAAEIRQKYKINRTPYNWIKSYKQPNSKIKKLDGVKKRILMTKYNLFGDVWPYRIASAQLLRQW